MSERQRCPECSVPVKAANLADHYSRVHPTAQARLPKSERVAMEKVAERAERRDRPRSHADWRIVAVVAVVLALVGLGVLALIVRPVSAGRIAVDHPEWDFGDIGQDVITHNFRLRNIGTGGLRLDGIATSCMCTSAQLAYGSQLSPRFGQHDNPPWQMTMLAGTEGVLTVFYDPTAHAERGHFQRDIYVLSDDPAVRELTITIHVNEV